MVCSQCKFALKQLPGLDRPGIEQGRRADARSFHWSYLAVPLLAMLSIGCHSEESVRQYRVPKPELLYAANHVAKQADSSDRQSVAQAPTDRMLAAIVPRTEQTWYFKMTGPTAAVAAQEPAFRSLIESLKFDPEASQPSWTLPDTWEQRAGTGQRQATLVANAGGQELEVSISQLTTSSSPDSTLDNVNRWRRQMGLTPITIDQLPEQSTTVAIADGTATLVNLEGNFKQTGMAGSSLAPSVDQSIDKPKSSAKKKRVVFVKPETWTEEPTVRFSDATLAIRDGDASARITVSSLPGDGGGLLQNLNRWNGQAGLPPLSEQDIASKTEKIAVHGIEGFYLEAAPASAAESRLAIYGWVGMQANESWFVKIQGDAELLQKQRDAFRGFLTSLKFNVTDGAVDDN
jgi:hypothetical protein